MPRRRTAKPSEARIEITEISGDKYPDLHAAQEAARAAIVADLADTLRALLAAGVLIQVDGRIIPNPNKPTHDRVHCSSRVTSTRF